MERKPTHDQLPLSGRDPFEPQIRGVWARQCDVDGFGVVIVRRLGATIGRTGWLKVLLSPEQFMLFEERAGNPAWTGGDRGYTDVTPIIQDETFVEPTRIPEQRVS